MSAARSQSARRWLLIALLAISVAGAAAASAWAIWSAGSSSVSRGAAAALVVEAGATPTADDRSGRTVTVSWGASTLSDGRAVAGYIVRRYDAVTGALQTTLPGCAGTVTTTSCLEASVPAGRWTYTIAGVIASNWQGPEGLKSGVVTIGGATLALAKTLFAAALPQNTTGSLAGFAANEGVTYRLDSGTPLTGSPSSVGPAGTATISSLTIPSTSDGAHTVYALGNASPVASQASAGIIVDTTPPTVSAQLDPVPNGAGWNHTSPVGVTLSADDGLGSGLRQITYTTDGSDPTTSGTAHTYSAEFFVTGNTTIKYFATDVAGNSSSVQTQLVKIDALAPTNGLTLSNITGGAFLGAGTIYYRGSAAGSFTLTNALSDTGGSGAVSSATAALSGLSTDFLHASSVVTTPAGGPFVSNPFSWSAGTTSSPNETVTGRDGADNTTQTTLGLTEDSTPPAGGSVDAIGLVGTGGRYSRSLTLQVGFSKGSDSGSGLAPTGSQLLRASAALSSNGTGDGACGSYGAFTPVGVGDPPSPVTDTVPTDDRCYRYRYAVPDQVGNVSAYTSPDIKVETTTPASLAPTTATITPVTGTEAQFLSGATLYYNPALFGTFTVASSSSDQYSGVAQLTFPALVGFSGGGVATTPNSGTTFRTTYSWSGNGASPASGAQSLTASNNAGASASTAGAFSLVKDTTAPSGGSVDASGLGGTGGRYSTSTTLSIALTKGTDGGSGIDATGAQLLRASATLSSDGTSNGTCGAYGTFVKVGADDPSSPTSDTVPADHTCYRYEYVVNDNVGNLTTYTSPDIKVDASGPAAPALTFSGLTNAVVVGTTVSYRPAATSGGFTVTASSVDTTSGTTGYAFPVLPAGWSRSTVGPGIESYSWSAANPTPPSGGQPVTVTNNAGGQSSTSFTVTISADTTPPSGGTVGYTNGYTTNAAVAVSFTQGTDEGSGLAAASGLLQRAAATLANGSCGTFGAFATIATNPTSPYSDPVTAGCYEYRYLISDNIGNQATYTSPNVVVVDQTPPTNAITITSSLGAASVSGGATLYYKGDASGSFKFVDAVGDANSGPASADFPSISTTGWTHTAETVSTPVGGPFVSSTYSWTANPGAPATQSVIGRDASGQTTGASVTFISDTSHPSGGAVGYADGVVDASSLPVTLTTGSDTGSGIDPAATVLKRDVAPLTTTTETCGTFPGTFATTVTLVGGVDTGVVSGNCYRYEYVVSDRVGNTTTYTSASVAKIDTSGPRVTALASLQSGGMAGNGKLEVGDKLVLTFDQSLATASVPTSFTGATETRASTGAGVTAPDARLTIPGLTNGALDTGSAAYFMGCPQNCPALTATFNGTVALVNSGTSTTVTATVTSLAGDAPAGSHGILVFAPAATITDGGGGSAGGSLTTAATFKLF
jgi:hypothetical protein